MSNVKRISFSNRRFRSQQRFSTKFNENFNENDNINIEIVDREENKIFISNDFSNFQMNNNNSNVENFDQIDSFNQKQKDSSKRDKEKKSVRNQTKNLTTSQLFNINENIYNKSIYQINAMTILFIYNNYENNNVFEDELNRENVTIAKTLYQLMTEFKKKLY